MFVDNGHRSHCLLLSFGQSFRTHDRSSAWSPAVHSAVHCQISIISLISVHVQTSDVVVMVPRNRKLALLLAVAVSAAPTLFCNIRNVKIFCLMKRFCKTILLLLLKEVGNARLGESD